MNIGYFVFTGKTRKQHMEESRLIARLQKMGYRLRDRAEKTYISKGE